MDKFIHIKAESEIYSINELCPEKKAEKRLKSILAGFIELKTKMKALYPSAHLKVQTCVHNPELFS